MHKRSGPIGFLLMMFVTAFGLAGCKSTQLSEINGKTAFGPQFHNYGDNTHAIKYYTIQTLEFKLANKWTLGVGYQRTDIDEGSGDNENLLLFEVGYPIWNAPKKAEKSAEELEIEGLERQLRMLDSELTAAGYGMTGSPSTAMVQSEKVE